jgi:hypothetical protein
MYFSFHSLSIAPSGGRIGLPNFINNYTRSVPATFASTVACQTTSFSVPPAPTFSSGCSPTPYMPGSYLWDFGEPSSGSANVATTSNPVHNYSNMGTYTVSLIMYSPCTNDTVTRVVTITTPGPTVSVSGVFEVCKGDKRIYTATGGGTYLWSNNSSASTVALAPATNTVYSVSTTSNGCTASKSFTVNVNPCTGLSGTAAANRLSVFPNPFNDILKLELPVPSEITVFDLHGNLVLKSKLAPGAHAINTADLSPGVYLMQAVNEEGVTRARVVKME